MQEFLYGTSMFLLYIIPMASVMLLSRKIFKIPDELFRKILHFILLGVYLVFLFAFETWWISATLAGIMMVIIYPILMLAGKIPHFSSFVNERKKGEFKNSMALAFGMIIASICICWGWIGDKYLVLASVYAWGVGDAFAALIGKRFGKHKIKWKFADSHKSIEGSLAMFLTSAFAVCVILLIRGGLDIVSCLVISCVTSIACTLVELCTKSGLDTITCPTVAMVIMIPFIKLLGN